MLRVVGDRDRLVDKKHRDTVLNPVRTPKSWVVERLVADQQKRTPVLRADQDAQKFFVKHSGRSADREPPGPPLITPGWLNGAGAPPMAKPGLAPGLCCAAACA